MRHHQYRLTHYYCRVIASVNRQASPNPLLESPASLTLLPQLNGTVSLIVLSMGNLGSTGAVCRVSCDPNSVRSLDSNWKEDETRSKCRGRRYQSSPTGSKSWLLNMSRWPYEARETRVGVFSSTGSFAIYLPPVAMQSCHIFP
jgi:hypothetical protein